MEYQIRSSAMQCQGLLDMTFQTLFLFSFLGFQISSNMTTSHEYQKVQAKKRPALCLSGHTFLNHRRRHSISLCSQFSSSARSLPGLPPLTPLIHGRTLCAAIEISSPITQKTKLASFQILTMFQALSGDFESSFVICFPRPRGKKPGSSPWAYLCSGYCFSQR